jgi:photosynthetic reaction center cytochrome c subunit
MQRSSSVLPWQAQFYAVFAAVSLFMAVGSIALVFWIANILQAGAPVQPRLDNDVYVNYRLNEPGAAPYITADSTRAIQQYIQQYPQPQNVQVLTGLSTAQIYAYMQQHFSGALKVDCSYCHNINNFGEEGNEKKTVARAMLLMTADLNQNWITQLPPEAGNKQVGCATCHNGKPVNFGGSGDLLSNYPADQSPLPDDWKLPLDNLDALRVTGEEDPDLGEVQMNQQTMNHMNQSLGVGCNFCHNANYFPSDERPQKAWALTMLQMSKHIKDNYGAIMANKEPSCWMCHQGQYIPPGSVNAGRLPPQISSNPSATQ